MPELTANDEFINKLAGAARQKGRIEPDLYARFNVKRGLRNNDGTGVLVGLTEVGEVMSYLMDDGEKMPVDGRLYYRGYEVSDLVGGFYNKRFGYEEIAYLLITGDLPSEEELKGFRSLLASRRDLPEGFTEDMILKAPSPDVMNKLARSVLASYSYDSNPESVELSNVMRQCIELIARFPVMVAYGYMARLRYIEKKSLFIHDPVSEYSTSENILHLIRPDGKFTNLEARVLDLAMVLHAEHGGGNNSTFVTHAVSSTGTDTYSAIAAAVGALKGPAHGGASGKAYAMMCDLREHVADYSDEGAVRDYLAKIIRREAFDRSGLIYGIGHAVYTLSDPRTRLLKMHAEELAKETGKDDIFKLYTMVERVAPEVFHEIKKSDKIMCANVDYYAGFVYSMLGIPPELFTPLFACARIAGWSAHRIEEIVSGGRIMRPAYKSVSRRREYLPMESRI